MVVIRWYY